MQSDPEFQSLNVAFVSIAFDPSDQQVSAITEYGISDVPMLIDAEHTVSEAYDVLKWAVGSGEPSHTFVLVDADGNIAWIRDYGSPSLPDPVMYVPPADLIQHIKDSL
ncbi:MAG: redoxin domain-containing protein [Anaerolineae bacterium]|nr:redoxin domain-containing protein [Anaerolineae bacterium]